MRHKKWRVGLRILLAVAMTGTVMQVDCLGTVAKNINPCGTVLNCDPVEYDFLFTEFPDWSIDPTCTIPSMCGGPFPGTSGTGRGGGVVQPTASQTQTQQTQQTVF